MVRKWSRRFPSILQDGLWLLHISTYQWDSVSSLRNRKRMKAISQLPSLCSKMLKCVPLTKEKYHIPEKKVTWNWYSEWCMTNLVMGTTHSVSGVPGLIYSYCKEAVQLWILNSITGNWKIVISFTVGQNSCGEFYIFSSLQLLNSWQRIAGKVLREL